MEQTEAMPHRVLLSRRDQLALATLVCTALCLLCWQQLLPGRRRDSRINIDLSAPVRIRFLISINQAPQSELILLPGIGPRLAERIVESRARDGKFRQPADLLRVKGIGPVKLKKIAPYLLRIDTGGQQTSSETCLPSGPPPPSKGQVWLY